MRHIYLCTGAEIYTCGNCPEDQIPVREGNLLLLYLLLLLLLLLLLYLLLLLLLLLYS
jgi:hypothetical protein